jgi:hypothetical protein
MAPAVIWPRQRRRPWSCVGQTLVALALFLMVLVPQGTMMARSGDQVFITICTGHGPATLAAPDGLGGKKTPPARKAPDSPCPFAGHAPPAPVPSVATFSRTSAFPPPTNAPRIADSVAPGQGLAAPPPPALASPHFLRVTG